MLRCSRWGASPSPCSLAWTGYPRTWTSPPALAAPPSPPGPRLLSPLRRVSWFRRILSISRSSAGATTWSAPPCSRCRSRQHQTTRRWPTATPPSPTRMGPWASPPPARPRTATRRPLIGRANNSNPGTDPSLLPYFFNDTATTEISPLSLHDALPISGDSAITDEDGTVGITLTGSDPDGDPLTFTVASNPANGALAGLAPNLTYTPAANFNGSDSFTFTVSYPPFYTP